MGGIIFQTIPQPLRKFQMKSAVVFLWMFISYKTGGKLTPPRNFQFPSIVGVWIFLWITHLTLYVVPKITCYLQRGLYKLHNAAQAIIMLSRLPIREMGSSFLIIRNVFSRLMACSTKMRRLAIVLVLCTSAFVNCYCPRFPGGIKRSALWSNRSSAIVNPRSAITASYGSRML